MSSSLRKTGSTSTWRKIRKLVIFRDGGMCVICGETEGLQVDHIVERQHGGGDQMDNLQTLCQRCHKSKIGGLFYTVSTPPTPPVLLSPQKGQNGHDRTGSSSIKTESVSHG